MNCGTELCIYNESSRCILDEIHIDSLGMCDECITVSIPAKLMKKLKHNQLEDINGRWKTADLEN